MSDFAFPSLPDPTPLPANSEGADVKAFAEPAARPPLTVGSTVSNAEDTAEPAQPVQPVQLESAIVPPDFQRQKVPLEKGFSQMDWMRLQSKGKDLQGNPMNGGVVRRQPVPMEEVKLHKTPEDGWTVVSGVVYNLSPYLRFHPGGAKILGAVLGKDGTKMFMKYHAWVNAPALLEKCIIGPLERGS